jgi:hypothetical protein
MSEATLDEVVAELRRVNALTLDLLEEAARDSGKTLREWALNTLKVEIPAQLRRGDLSRELQKERGR